jgi:arylsulfatase A-like enzyme
MDRIAREGITFNRFHAMAMYSPTRAALLTRRNHHRVGAGQIAEFANDRDGYSGVQLKTSAMVTEVLKAYGYDSGARGKWHNAPADHTTAAGPFDYWPTGCGFEYFYGVLAGEATQYEPHLVRNTTIVHPSNPRDGQPYHLSEDLADDAIGWLRQHKAVAPDKPFFVYWASGASRGPRQVPQEWADRYKGRFDDGWDKYRERAFANAKARGWIPQNAQLTPRPVGLPARDDIPEKERPLQRRLMEVFAGFTEHVDTQVGRIVDEVDRLGYGDNTRIVCIWGDNGPSAEGQASAISELLAQNGIPNTADQHLAALETPGGLDALGSPVSVDCFDRAPFPLAGTIQQMQVRYTDRAIARVLEPSAAHVNCTAILSTPASRSAAPAPRRFTRPLQCARASAPMPRTIIGICAEHALRAAPCGACC